MLWLTCALSQKVVTLGATVIVITGSHADQQGHYEQQNYYAGAPCPFLAFCAPQLSYNCDLSRGFS